MIPVTPSSTHEEPAQGLGKPRADRMRIVNRLSRRVTGFWSTDPDPILMVAVILIALTVYVATAAPTVTSEDSGELIAAAYCFGVPHPPGYPLWTILAGISLRALPLGTVAWRVNVFSGFCSALAVGLLAVTLRELGLRWWSSLAASLAVAFGAVLWSQSVIAEVYALHALCFAAALWTVVRWERTRRSSYLVVASAVIGLGMCNHHLMAFSAIGLAGWVLCRWPRVLLRPLVISACVGAFAVALTPYGYLYVRAQADPVLNWGEPKTAPALIDHVARRQYRSTDPSKAVPPKSLSNYTGELSTIGLYVLREPTPYLALFALPGIVWMLRRHRKLALLWGWLTVAHVGLYLAFVGVGTDRGSLWCCKVFFIAQYLTMALPTAFGIESVANWIGDGLRTAAPTKRVLPLCPAIAAPLLVLLPLSRHWPENNYRNYWYAEDHARNMLACMLPRGIIFPTGDHNTFPLIYMTQVEKLRPDITIADKYGYIDLALYADMPDLGGRRPRTPEERDVIEEWIIRHARRPVYYTVRKESLVDNAHAVPVGVLYHLLPETKGLDRDTPWSHIHYRNLDETCVAPRDYGADNILADFEFFRALRELEHGNPSAGLERFAQSSTYGWGIKEVQNNIGSALAENGLADEAVAYFRHASQLDPKYTTSRWNAARVLKALQRWEEAESAFEELTRITPADFRVFGEFGFLGLKRGRPAEEVRSRFERSLSLNPHQPQILEVLPKVVKPPANSSESATP